MDDESMKKGDGAKKEGRNGCSPAPGLVGTKNAIPRPALLVAIVIGSLYLTEVIIMNFFHEFAETAHGTMDALILTAITLPLLYFFIYRPFSKNVKDLKALSGTLERQVRERTVELEFSEALHRAVITSSADAIVQINSDGVILMANPAAHWMLGYGKTELENKHISLLLPGGYEKVLVEGFAASLNGWDGHSAAPVAEAVAVTKSGKKLTVECASSECLVNSEISFVIDMRDVTERKKAEKELISIMEAQPDILYVINLNGALIKWNSALQELCGLTRAQMMERPAADFVCEEDRPVVYEGIKEVFEKGSASIEARFIRHDGALVPHLCNGAVWRNLDGEPLGFIGVGKDISERKKAEEALAESEARYRQLSEAGFEGIVINIDGKVIDCNSAFARMFGYEPEEIIGKVPLDLSPPESHAIIMDHIRRESVEVYDVMGRKKDGTLFPIEMQGRAILYHGQKARLTAMRDISERVKAEQALQESEVRYRLLSDLSFEGISISVKGQIVDANAALAQMAGCMLDELIGKNVFDLTAPESHAVIMEHIDKGIESAPYEVTGVRKDGSMFRGEVKGRNILYRGQMARGTAIRDITERVKAEEAIRESEGRYRQLSEASFEGVTITVGGKIVDCNTFFARKFGYTPDEIIGKTPLDLVPPESYAIVADHIGRGSEESYEAVGLKKNGTLFPIEIQGRATLYHGQKARVTAIRDISERVKAEQAIRESEERLRSTFDSATSGMAFVNPDGTFARVNEALCQMYGYREQELIGKSFQEITHPDDLHIGETFLRKVARGETAKLEVEKRFIRKDGGIVWCSVVASLIKDAQGKPLHLFSHVIDVSARREAEKIIHQMSLFPKFNPGPIIRCDANGVILMANPAAGAVFEKENLEGVAVQDIIPDIGMVDLAGIVRDDLLIYFTAALNKGHFQFAIRGVAELGVMNIYGSDVTARKEAEERLKEAKDAAEEANRLKDKFVSLVSHDLKTPLSSMIGFLKLVRNDYAEPLNEGAKLILDRATESGEAMVHLIDDLLTISRFKTGQLKLNRQFFDAEYLGVIMAGNYAHLARQKGIEIENTIPANSRIYGDKTLLAEAVQNLVTNAIKFCKNSDHITISLAESNASTICVRDTGPGIPPNMLADLFKFEKKTSTRGTAGETGTGFGLPLVKVILQLHGGELTVESMPGKGCLVCLTLPYVRPKILLVDDDKHARLLQMLQLREMKADIIEAENGQDALNKMAAIRPDLIITDIQMPVMDGIELLKRIKGAPDTKDIPVIVQSGEFGMEIRDTIFKFGGDDFITKNKTDKVDFFPRVRRFIG